MFLQAHLHLFYPINLLVLGLLERGQQIPHVVLQYHHLLHYAMAGAFTYLYARQLALGRFAAAVSGIAFMFSGFMLAHVTHWTMIDTVVWLPAILACLVRADATLRPRWAALAGLALGVAFLAGHPQLFYHVVLGDRRARRHADRAARGGCAGAFLGRGSHGSCSSCRRSRSGYRRGAAHPAVEMAVRVAPARRSATNWRRVRRAGDRDAGARSPCGERHVRPWVTGLGQRAAGAHRARRSRAPRRVLAAGRHQVEFRFRQPSVFVGLGITLATLGVARIVAGRRRPGDSAPGPAAGPSLRRGDLRDAPGAGGRGGSDPHMAHRRRRKTHRPLRPAVPQELRPL